MSGWIKLRSIVRPLSPGHTGNRNPYHVVIVRRLVHSTWRFLPYIIRAKKQSAANADRTYQTLELEHKQEADSVKTIKRFQLWVKKMKVTNGNRRYRKKERGKAEKELTRRRFQKRKKMLVYPFVLPDFRRGYVIIFDPSGDKNDEQPDGFNSELPIPKDEVIRR